ncbi:MAG: hypothetical protein CO188_10325 [Zetaproteobacteria bacterium CG_4_9_14_3_um_filter_54_145]|nr:MAG: hypothetical protein COZ50_10470 [Zetaproteobacteria bacterium CG_4_10_14_3_um_filter_54_28]PJA28145.1 MAG: hypothetical protein CO188_10325 [Zetaproteobacteria bacterium CG_4_9_14_3_um_filter_54_145]
MFSVHHVALSVQSLHASVAFYDVFGFKPVYSWSSEDDKLTIVHLSHGDTLLELFCYRQPDPAPDSSHALATDLPRIGIKHFGLRVQDIHAAHAHLQQLGMSEGVAICHGRTGIDYFFIKDPSGILLEVVQDDRMATLDICLRSLCSGYLIRIYRFEDMAGYGQLVRFQSLEDRNGLTDRCLVKSQPVSVDVVVTAKAGVLLAEGLANFIERAILIEQRIQFLLPGMAIMLLGKGGIIEGEQCIPLFCLERLMVLADHLIGLRLIGGIIHRAAEQQRW